MTYDSWLQPPDPHDCDDEGCSGDACADRAAQAREDFEIERADARRKGDL